MTRKTALGLLVLTVGASACEEEGIPAVRLTVTSDIGVGLESVTVTVTASRSADEPRLCAPVARSFPESPDAGPLQLPIEVVVERGTEYSAWMAFRVQGWRPGDTDPAVTIEDKVEWPAAGVLDVRVDLLELCVERSCPVVQQCIRGACAGLRTVGVFTDPTLQVTSLSCMEE
mgnify:CR=1 FL=1